MIDKPITTNSQSLSSIEKARPKTQWFTLFIAMLALLFSVAAIAAGYKHWQRTIDKVRVNQLAISDLKNELASLRKTTDSSSIRDEFAKTLQDSQEQQETTVKALQTLQTQTAQTADSINAQLTQLGSLQVRLQPNTPEQANEWLVKQAELLLQTANREFAINQQPTLALQAFKQANETLAQVSDVSYLPVRTQLSNDINTVQNFKPGMMGPLAGIGDTLIWVLYPTIMGSIAAYMGLEGNPTGALIWMLLNVIFFFRIKLFHLGYDSGLKLITTLGDKLSVFTEAASIMGLTVIGALIPSVVKMSLGLVFKSGKVKLAIQTGVLDKIMPALLPVALTFIVYKLLASKKLTVIQVIFLIIVLALVCSFFGILAL